MALSARQQLVFDALRELKGGKWDRALDEHIPLCGLCMPFEDGYKSRQGSCPYPESSMEFAAWMAGRESRRMAGGRPALAEDEKRHPGSIRLSRKRWSMLRALGTNWLEQAIDQEMQRRSDCNDVGHKRGEKISKVSE